MNNQYDFNIENSRPKNTQNGININQNPYINQNINPLQTPTQNQMQVANSNGFINNDFVKGALLGAAVTYLLTNKNAQETILKAFGKGSELFQAGIEELKERYEDAKAQMQAQQEQ
ncbi:MAG: YtxH domain-containing protein [Arcobacter sp.]|uniref:YtxH domain-containing protein n=1 Tax=Arcobacter sp. TaxID=1872629 RepID=UPI003CFC9341